MIHGYYSTKKWRLFYYNSIPFIMKGGGGSALQRNIRADDDYGVQFAVSSNEFPMSKRNLCLITHCRCLREAKLEILKDFAFFNYCRKVFT